MEYCIESLGNSIVFSTLDANCGYWYIPIAAEDRQKTRFTTHMGTYQYQTMTLVLLNELETF